MLPAEPAHPGDAKVRLDLQPCLTGSLIELRPLRPEDYHDLFAVAADPAIWEQHPDKDRCNEDSFRAFFRKALSSGGALLVVDRGSGQVIGTSRYHGYDARRREVEIGWTFLARPYWGGRYNGELKRLMLEHAFRFVDRVLFVVAPGNVRSQRAVEKIGGIRAGSRRQDGREDFVYVIAAPGARPPGPGQEALA